MAGHHLTWTRAAAATLALVMVVGCSTTSEADEALQRQKAEELVAATKEAGIAPRLTVQVAESLYGTEAPAVCEAFEGGSTTSAEVILRGNVAQGRRKVITKDAVIYAGLVVRTYCPDVLADFRRNVTSIDALNTSGK